MKTRETHSIYDVSMTILSGLHAIYPHSPSYAIGDKTTKGRKRGRKRVSGSKTANIQESAARENSRDDGNMFGRVVLGVVNRCVSDGSCAVLV